MQQEIEWLKGYFSERSALPEKVEEQNYFTLGLIDSFGAIELIEALEQRFGIRFTEDHFQDRRFVTIKGLAEIISEIRDV